MLKIAISAMPRTTDLVERVVRNMIGGLNVMKLEPVSDSYKHSNKKDKSDRDLQEGD